ncbi:MAG: PAS domain-containing protein, partial [bacterium]|nr:PAS domain-containing protein [bacterium]
VELALRGANLGTWDWNIQTGEVFFDKRWVEMIGYEEGELKPHYTTWENLLHPDDKERVQTVLTQHFEEGTEYSIEFRLREKVGSWCWILASGKVFERDEGGNPLRMTGVHLDSTERKRTEEELQESEEKFSKAFKSNASMMALSTLEDGMFIDVNDEFMHTFGFEREEIIGKTSKELQLFGDIIQRDAIRQIIKEKGCVRNFEMTARTKNGELRNGLFSGDIIQLQKQTCWLTVFHDITERKRADEEKVILEKQLQQAQKMEA